MTHVFQLKTSLIVAALLALPMAAQAQSMTKADYSAAKSRVSAQYKADKAACASMAGNNKDICVLQAKGKEKVARAELEYGYTGKPADKNKVAVVKAETTYAVAKERCDDKAGDAKGLCVSEAKAIQTKALADAKMGKEIVKAEKDATEDKREADYKVALEKCETLAGDAKAACVGAAKAKFGKS